MENIKRLLYILFRVGSLNGYEMNNFFEDLQKSVHSVHAPLAFKIFSRLVLKKIVLKLQFWFASMKTY